MCGTFPYFLLVMFVSVNYFISFLVSTVVLRDFMYFVPVGRHFIIFLFFLSFPFVCLSILAVLTSLSVLVLCFRSQSLTL